MEVFFHPAPDSCVFIRAISWQRLYIHTHTRSYTTGPPRRSVVTEIMIVLSGGHSITRNSWGLLFLKTRFLTGHIEKLSGRLPDMIYLGQHRMSPGVK